MAERLLGEFASVPLETWKAQVEAELKGVPFEKKLVTPTWEGIDLQPLYTAEDVVDLEHLRARPGFDGMVRGAFPEGNVAEPWEVSQELPYPGPREFNVAARHDLSRGLTALNINLDQATRAGLDPDSALEGDVGRGGVSIATLKDLSIAVEDIDLEKTSLFVRSGASGLPFAAMLAALVAQRGLRLSSLHGCIEMDPLGVLAHEGTLPQSMEEAYREMAALTRWAADHAPNLQTICVHSRSFHEAGGNAVQELAFALAMGVQYLREMQARGLSVDLVAPRIRFAFCVGSNVFMEISKFRAARLLWSRIVEAMGGSEDVRGMTIHARTALWNKSKLDPYVNMLRTTTESFSAVLGGVQSLQVTPFDEVFGLPDEFSRRIARNQQILLASESQLTHVVDPAGGSWAVEWITDQIAQKAWSLFQEVEAKGGMLAALGEEFVQKSIEAVCQAREKALAVGKDVLVGVNQYANIGERKPEGRQPDLAAIYKSRVAAVADYRTAYDDVKHAKVMAKLGDMLEATDATVLQAAIEAVEAGATLGEITRVIRRQIDEPPRIRPLNLHRISEPFETLRAASDSHLAKTGRRPTAFLATMGPLAQHKARADFARGFLEVGGFDVLYPQGFETVESAVRSALDSGSKIVVVCSTDATYPEIVPFLVPALKQAIPGVVVVLAGNPVDQIEAHKASGVDEFLHLRANRLSLLTGLQKKIGVQ
ncbi:MAG: acyl-CoA mutase large subunit family protein [Fibrobacteria bacterium]|nr:acyl-CoA mutase large subunit family protein [Fibrobacteria bacterium]